VPLQDPEFARWLVGSIRSGLIAIDASGAVAALNAEAHRILRCALPSPADAIGVDCRSALAPQAGVARLLLEALDGRERPSRAELVLDHRDGRPQLTIGYTLGAVRDGAGCVRGAVLQFRDLTPYERSAEQERLRERLAALGEMAAGLAHEIRNPLAGMEVTAGLLARRVRGSPEQAALVDELRAELRRLAATVTDCLEFVRPVALRQEPVDPVAVLEQSLARARSRVAFAGAVERAYADAPPALRGDAEALLAVLTNLIVNAFEAMEGASAASQRVRLELEVGADAEAGGGRRPARELVFTVADSGPGIPDELHERIFYPFFTTKQRGSGVGLAHAQKVVAGHGGRLELESAAGHGATFRVRLPLPPAGAASEAA
jgi:signal transduction histidine kinase